LRTLIAIVVSTLLSAHADVASSEAEWLEFRPSTVRLTGRFELVLRFGPPNYGEDPKTDLKIEVPTLLLAEPIRVRGRLGDDIDDEPVEGVRMLQLLLPAAVDRYEFLGMEVLVTGELTHATRGAEFTPIVMGVQEIQAGRP
jgi:hypothetical protein